MIRIDIQKALHGADGPFQFHMTAEIDEGSCLALYGPSGAGKTSTLRMMAGLMNPDLGKIIVGNQVWYDSESKINLKAEQRKTGYVFQDYALFPNMTVRQNIQFAAGNNEAKTADKWIGLTGLGDLAEKKPAMLSGGQQQRVALARALTQQPSVLLLDEPLSALDQQMRIKLQQDLMDYRREQKLTTILISHDAGEIIKLADQVVVLENGLVTKSGTPDEVFIHQQISGKFRFTGEVLKVTREEVLHVVTARVEDNIVRVVVDPELAATLSPGDRVVLVSKAFNPMVFKVEG